MATHTAPRCRPGLALLVLSFAISVVGTRVYLEATGYPQIGGSVLHIAHVLWGGLLLFLGVCVVLTYGNRWKYSVGAILGGAAWACSSTRSASSSPRATITSSRFAAPIIYGFFLLT